MKCVEKSTVGNNTVYFPKDLQKFIFLIKMYNLNNMATLFTFSPCNE